MPDMYVLHVYMHMYVFVHIYMYVLSAIYMYLCICLFVCVWDYIYIYIYIYIHINFNKATLRDPLIHNTSICIHTYAYIYTYIQQSFITCSDMSCAYNVSRSSNISGQINGQTHGGLTTDVYRSNITTCKKHQTPSVTIRQLPGLLHTWFMYLDHKPRIQQVCACVLFACMHACMYSYLYLDHMPRIQQVYTCSHACMHVHIYVSRPHAQDTTGLYVFACMHACTYLCI
jgi:hypothetical protein